MSINLGGVVDARPTVWIIGKLFDNRSSPVVTAISGVLLVLWTRPLWRAIDAQHVEIAKVTRETLTLRGPATLATVLRDEHPERIESASVAPQMS